MHYFQRVLIKYDKANDNMTQHIMENCKLIIIYSPGQKAQILISYLKQKGVSSLQKLLCSLNIAHEHNGHKGIADKLKQKIHSNGFDCNNFYSHDCEECCRSELTIYS